MRLTERVRRRDDGGFSLIELIITVSILGIIVAALANVVIVYLKTTTATQSRLTESQDVQLAAAYWQRDVASIGVRAYDSSTKTFPLQPSVNTATPGPCVVSGSPVISLAWSKYSDTDLDSTAGTGTVTITYFAQPDGPVFDLVRVRCDGSSPTSQVKVASNLRVKPQPTCDGAACGSGATPPQVIALPLSVVDPDGDTTKQYDITLTGERRQT